MTKNDLPINTMKTKEHFRHKKKIGDEIWCAGGNVSSNITITTTVA